MSMIYTRGIRKVCGRPDVEQAWFFCYESVKLQDNGLISEGVGHVGMIPDDERSRDT